MYSRRTMLSLSIAVSLLAYAGFLVLAPSMRVRTVHVAPRFTARHFRVQVRDVPPPEEPQSQDEARELATSPGTIEDLLDMEDEKLAPIESLLNQAVDVPQLSDRVASETIEREHHLKRDPDSARVVDAKIIEIAEDTARQDIEIARRLVRPSPERVLGPGEYPVLRGPSDLGEEPIVVSALPSKSLLGEPVRPPSGQRAGEETGKEKPPYEAGAVAPEPPPREPPVLPPEQRPVAPVVEEIRDENPYEFLDDLLDIKIDTYFPPQEKAGFFRVRIVPKKGGQIAVLPKDVTFVIDASNSIVQHKLDNTAKGLREMVSKLRPEDRFNVIVFRDTANPFRAERVPASEENKAAALAFLSDLESRGETDVYNAIRPVVDTPPREGLPGVVFVMTDGRPTKGVRDARTIINALSEENTGGNTIFAYGGGNTVDQYLLELLAYRNKGESKVSLTIGGIAEELPAFFERIGDPLLVDLQADYGRIDEQNVFPKKVPDFYEKRAVTVYGHFDPDADTDFTMRLTGVAGARKKEVIFKADLREAASGDDRIAHDWAFEKIYHLIDEMCRVGEQPELLDELHRLSRKYNIRTSYDE